MIISQRWIYRIDPNRANEYGQVLDDKQKEKVQKEEEAKGKLQDLGKATQKKVAAVVAPESKKNQ